MVGVLLLVRSASAAQTVTATTGAVNGIVTDSSHAVVPGVTITLSGPALITPRTTLTDDTGAYRFSAVPPGDHTLTFDLPGFANDRSRRHSDRPRLHGDGQRRNESRQHPRQRLGPWFSRCGCLLSGGDDPFRRRQARHAAWLARHFFRPGQHAGCRPAEDGRRRQWRPRPAGLHRLRPALRPRRASQRGRRHPGWRGQRIERQLPLRLRVLRRDRRHGRRPFRGHARSGHSGPIREQVRRERLSRQRVRRFPE